MKLNKFKDNKSNLKTILALKLIKNKIDTQNILAIKNNLKIISLYIANRKKILFIGAYNKIDLYYRTLFYYTNFIFIPTNLIQNGFFSNIYVYENLFVKKSVSDLKFLFNFQSLNFDLIVLLEDDPISHEVLKLSKVPVIFFSNFMNTLPNQYTLTSLGLVKQESDVFYFLIFNIFKKYKVK